MARGFAVMIVIAIGLGTLWLLGDIMTPNQAGRTAQPARAAPEPPPDPNWIEDDKTKTTLTTFIQASGLNCPAVKLAHKRGPDPYGNVIKVWCGPAGSSGVYQNLIFRVTVKTNGLPMIRPWTD